ncbi:hypothetical protein TIFTF001_008933 [Ficus carica]|uniref:Uncharacterized protein n=1 Tax=Ficus carica TaxID=3494 RepID=A0AA87ZNX5_FICCA|nr:hypothetical protein TIFTF001_008933 [Ficus carica]
MEGWSRGELLASSLQAARLGWAANLAGFPAARRSGLDWTAAAAAAAAAEFRSWSLYFRFDESDFPLPDECANERREISAPLNILS